MSFPNPSRPRPEPVRAGRRASAPWMVGLVLSLLAGAAAAGKAHQHGVAKLDVTLEGQRLTLSLDSPLDNLVGFERAPRTAAERQRVQAMADTLKDAARVFTPDAAAGCTALPSELLAPVAGLGTAAAAGAPAAKPADPAGHSHGHADLEATFAFDCRQPDALRSIEAGLFKAFPGFKRIEVQLATPKGQASRTLTPAAPRLALPR